MSLDLKIGLQIDGPTDHRGIGIVPGSQKASNLANATVNGAMAKIRRAAELLGCNSNFLMTRSTVSTASSSNSPPVRRTPTSDIIRDDTQRGLDDMRDCVPPDDADHSTAPDDNDPLNVEPNGFIANVYVDDVTMILWAMRKLNLLSYPIACMWSKIVAQDLRLQSSNTRTNWPHPLQRPGQRSEAARSMVSPPLSSTVPLTSAATPAVPARVQKDASSPVPSPPRNALKNQTSSCTHW